MGNTIKRFLTNKNTVTLLAIVACVVVLYLFYNWRVKQAVTTTEVCYATQTIPARTEITEDMISTTKVLTTQVSDNMITDCADVKGKYASYASEIPANSFFYNENVMTAEEMPNSAFADIPDGYTIFNYEVDFNRTYGNSIFPNDYIDIYIKMNDDTQDDKLIYGKFVQSIKVLAVKDSEGRNVFETTVEAREPANLLFAVPEDLYLLLMKSQYLGYETVLVPKNNNYTAEAGETLVSSEYLKQRILEKTIAIPDECILAETGLAECNVDADDLANAENNNNN